MSFLLLHIIYQITVNSLLAGNSITSDFNCKYTAAFVVKALKLVGFVVYIEIKATHSSGIHIGGVEWSLQTFYNVRYSY